MVDTDTMCDLLRAVAARRWVGPVTLVRDNARYPRNDVVNGPAGTRSYDPAALVPAPRTAPIAAPSPGRVARAGGVRT